MKRRHAIAAIGAAWLPLAAQAAPPRRIGLMMNLPLASPIGLKMRTSFAEQMRLRGLVDGRDYVAIWRSSEGKYERIPALAAELVAMKVDVIVTHNTLSTLAAKRLTHTIPIVFSSVDDPIGLGVVQNLAHPEANVTGFTGSTDSVLGKHLDLLLAAIPGLSRIGLLRNPDNVKITAIEAELQELARSRTLPPLVNLQAKDDAQLEAAFDAARGARLQAVLVYADGFFLGRCERIGALAIKARMPTIARSREYVEGGLLFSYGESTYDDNGGVADYVAKLLAGIPPASLPVQRPRAFPFVINRRTANAIGLKLDEAILLRANEVIE